MANKYKITPKYTIPAGVAGNYRKGHAKPEGVVIHASANPNAGIDSEIDFMTRNYRNAFTHAWAGHDKIIEISNTDYACWGAGAIANKRFAQIETTEDKRLTKKQKLQVIDRAAYWAAVQLVYYKLPCKDASKDGSGTVWGHVHVSKYLGGTDHTDPIAYFNSVGVSWNDFYKQVERYYNAYKKGTSDQVKSLDGTQGTVKPSTPAPSKDNKKADGHLSFSQVVDKTIAGGYGVYPQREKNINVKTNFTYKAVQDEVNKRFGATKTKPSTKPAPKKKSAEQVAQDIAKGLGGWGNNPQRAQKLKAAGYNATTVQNRVNEILSGKKSAPKKTASKTAKVGDTVTAKALYGTAQSTKNVRSSNIKGYVADIDNSRRNPIRLRNKKGGYYLGFTRQQDLV